MEKHIFKIIPWKKSIKVSKNDTMLKHFQITAQVHCMRNLFCSGINFVNLQCLHIKLRKDSEIELEQLISAIGKRCPKVKDLSLETIGCAVEAKSNMILCLLIKNPAEAFQNMKHMERKIHSTSNSETFKVAAPFSSYAITDGIPAAGNKRDNQGIARTGTERRRRGAGHTAARNRCQRNSS